MRQSGLQAIFVFIMPPSTEELERRLRARGTEREEQVQQRLHTAVQELDRSAGPACRAVLPAAACSVLGVHLLLMHHWLNASCVVTT